MLEVLRMAGAYYKTQDAEAFMRILKLYYDAGTKEEVFADYLYNHLVAGLKELRRGMQVSDADERFSLVYANELEIYEQLVGQSFIARNN